MLAWTYIKTARALTSLSVSVSSLEIYQMSLASTILRLNLSLQNTSSVDLTVNKVVGSIKAADASFFTSSLGTFNYSGAVRCKGDNASTAINNVMVQVSNLQAITLLISKYKWNKTKKKFLPTNQKQNYTISGYLVANGNKLPFTTTQAF